MQSEDHVSEEITIIVPRLRDVSGREAMGKIYASSGLLTLTANSTSPAPRSSTPPSLADLTKETPKVSSWKG
ncbi:hypothetical protein [Glutamicibacter ardleyensis]|uniref:hypothetical protein n=1 Tax=Glutamicibacter ardleyensis TaxID=225894 RepID=UPI003FD06FE2